AILARPISRAEFVIGKWLGVIATILIYALPTTALQLFLVDRIVQYVPPHPFEFVGFMVIEGIVVLTLALALSTRLAGMVGGVVALILWGVAWIGGIVGGVGLVLNNATATHIGTATRLILPTDGMWRGAVWALEPATIIAAIRASGPAAAGNPFFASEPPDALYLAWTAAWIVAFLGLGIWSFQQRRTGLRRPRGLADRSTRLRDVRARRRVAHRRRPRARGADRPATALRAARDHRGHRSRAPLHRHGRRQHAAHPRVRRTRVGRARTDLLDDDWQAAHRAVRVV